MKIIKKTPEKEILLISTSCKQCGKCCTLGVGYAKEEELIKIAEKLKITIQELKEKHFEKHIIFNKIVYKPKQKKENLPFGPCVFLKENMCEIHEVKPLHCRVGNCNEQGDELTEWYYSNHLVNYNDPQSIREWETRITLKPTIKGGSPKENMDDKTLKKIVGYKIFNKEDLKKEK